MNDTVVRQVVHDAARQRSLLELRDGSMLVIGAELVRYARDAKSLDDPLGNGMHGVIPIPAALAPQWEEAGGFVAEQLGGAVLLHGGSALLVKPYSIELYASANDALHARDCRGRIDLERR